MLHGQPVESTLERRVEAALNKVRRSPLALRGFLFTMPKGADLHNHLSGAVYAETYIRDAAEDNICIDPTAYSFSRICGSGHGQVTGKVASGNRLSSLAHWRAWW